MSDFPVEPQVAVVDVKPNYVAKHWLGDILLGLAGLAGIIATQTGPLPGISPEVWKWITVIALAVGTMAKMKQSQSGATTAAAPPR